jgi:carbonic anhydrase
LFVALVSGSLLVAACSGGGDDHAATASTVTGDSAGGDVHVDDVGNVAATDDGHDGAGDAGHGSGSSGATVSKESFDELKLQVLELTVEVDKLQTMLGLTTDGVEPEQSGDGSDAGDDGDEGEEHGDTPHWTYEEAARWHELAEEFSACGDGLEQSPIDLTGSVGLDLPNIVLDYVPSDATIVDNGHTVQVNVPDAGTLELDGKRYSFLQFHFHSPSEHTVEGDHWPMEWHFVHQADDGSLAVLGVLVEEGPEWPAFDVIIDSLPLEKEVEDIVYGQVDLDAFMPDLTAAYHYDGSLTTPPCSEGVEWSVLQASITMSAEQMQAFTSRFEEPNNRPVQPIHDRTLEKDLSA